MFNFNLTKRYIPALLLIAVFVIISNYLSQKVIESNNEYAKLINISGKQRMLSQKLIILATNYSMNSTNKNKIISTVEEMKKSHKYLLTKILTVNLSNIYYKYNLDKNLNSYLLNFYKLLDTKKPQYLQDAINSSETILIQLDNVVKEYERDSNYQLSQLEKYEFYLMLLTLFVLFLEMLFIFKPASQQIDKMTADIVEEKEYGNTVIESSNDAIIAIDWTAKITTYNKKAEEIFGWTKDEMIGSRNLINIIPEKYKKAHNKASSNYLSTGKSSGVLGQSIELEGIRKDGTIFPIMISFGAKYKIKGAIVVANITDITFQKEEDKALLQQSKMASMGEMISNIAHQWRQPLSLISTLSSGALAKKEYDLLSDEEFIETMTDIDKSVQFLSKTIDDFRNFYKVSNTKEIFSIDSAIDTIETITRDSYQVDNISINKVIESASLKCYGIESQLSQVLLNMFNNSRDILVENNIKEKKVFIHIVQDDDIIKLKFYDNAGGIPDDILPKVFEPYFTTKHKKQGTGIGLHMSYEIIHKHFNGELLVSNEYFTIEDKKYFGACFSISIPANLE